MIYQIVKNNITEKFKVRTRPKWWPFWHYVISGYCDTVMEFSTEREAEKFIRERISLREEIAKFKREQIVGTIEGK